MLKRIVQQLKVANELILELTAVVYTLYQNTLGMKTGLKSKVFYPAKIVNPSNIAIGSGCQIQPHVWLNTKTADFPGPSLQIGSNTRIGSYTQINAWCSVKIGDNVLISDRVFISDADHIIVNRNIPIKNQGDEFKGEVSIGDGSWLGIGSVILPGVKIGKHCVVGANSVISRNIPDYSIFSGNNGKFINNIK
jgi:acetyltransferase-like isoleucine patch superfamily enzyme